MIFEKSGVNAWLDRATSPLKFPPDRRSARSELLDHIIDHTEACQRSFPNMTRGEAERMAVEQMGDPEEVGRELSKLHHPWVGCLWYACRGLLAVSLFIVIFFVLLQPGSMKRILGEDDIVSRHREYPFLGSEVEPWTAPAPVDLEHYQVEVTRAARFEERWDFEDGSREPLACESAAITLRLTARHFWDRPVADNDGLELGLTFVDSGGKAGNFRRGISLSDQYLHHWLREPEEPLLPGKKGWNWQEYELTARNLTPGAEAVTLHFDLGDTEFTIRVPVPADSHYFSGNIIHEGEKLPW